MSQPFVTFQAIRFDLYYFPDPELYDVRHIIGIKRIRLILSGSHLPVRIVVIRMGFQFIDVLVVLANEVAGFSEVFLSLIRKSNYPISGGPDSLC